MCGKNDFIAHVDDVDSPEQRRAMRLRHAQLGMRMQALAAAALQELEKKVADGKPLGLSREDAEKLRETGEEMERSALGGEDNATISPNTPRKPN